MPNDFTHYRGMPVEDVFHYDPITGLVTWKIHVGGTSKPGKIAGTALGGKGYRALRTRGGKWCVLIHRFAWYAMTGEWPTNEIDHINGNPSDNRWCNLRAATHAENRRNSVRYKNNTSGYKGVQWNKRAGRWNAVIVHYGKSLWLGTFSNPQDAHAAYCEASKRLHGQFGRTE